MATPLIVQELSQVNYRSMGDCLKALGRISGVCNSEMLTNLALETPLLNTLGLVMIKGANAHKIDAIFLLANIAANSQDCAKAVLKNDQLLETLVKAMEIRDPLLQYEAMFAVNNMLSKLDDCELVSPKMVEKAV
jgi:hypothetical protein